MNEWISVEDGLPASDISRCLVCCVASGEIQLASVVLGTISGATFRYEDDNDWISGVTHWMPLPAPPTTQKGNEIR